ncbi:hypothetical protein DSLASN_27770 [Desulfoluna limicola]|uniref:Uncharacterized protein n=1 Tax=Desulfoluna limicola TaxID=2810562 RepID=A0ABN6F9D8_9BACT|nr:hypothetical protein [Desulfoluna limicola]BCS97145.1 hypothetical protein DSLASN_27770 [Desulfoluna limicola]
MKRLLILIAGTFLLTTSVMAVAAEKPAPFSPAIHNAENLPANILYMKNGTIYLVTQNSLVVNDATYPLSSKAQVFTKEGLKVTRKNLKKGQKVDLFANTKHEAVYIVLK